MNTTKKTGTLLMTVLMLSGYVTFGQQANSNSKSLTSSKEAKMKTYLIERNIPNAGQMTNEQLQAISQKSCDVLSTMGSQIEWDHSYVVGDKIFCVYRAANEELVKEHAKEGGFPADHIYTVSSIIGPKSAKGVIQNTK